jgi:hypothetical protein
LTATPTSNVEFSTIGAALIPYASLGAAPFRYLKTIVAFVRQLAYHA